MLAAILRTFLDARRRHCPDKLRDDALEQLRHDLKTPLITIHGRAQLLGRAIRRSPSLTDDERARMLAAVVAIETTVRAMVPLIDSMGDAGNDGKRDIG